MGDDAGRRESRSMEETKVHKNKLIDKRCSYCDYSLDWSSLVLTSEVSIQRKYLMREVKDALGDVMI